MKILTEAVTEVEYNTSLSDENYPVLFGAIAEIGDRIVSVMDERNSTHASVGIYGGEWLAWRYVPMTETLYWWFRPTLEDKKRVKDYIFKKYQFKVLHNAVMDREGMITNHSKKYSKDYYEKPPSFADWYKAHQGD